MPAPAQILAFPRSPEHIRDGGFVPLYRREFTEGDSVLGDDRQLIGVWIEMFATARWQDDPVDVLVGGSMVRVEHGQLIMNYRIWAKRWGLSAAKLFRACKAMAEDGRIRIEVKQLRNSHETACTVITICNLDKYRAFSEVRETALEQLRNTYKEDEESNNSLSSPNGDDSPSGLDGRDGPPPKWSVKQTDEALNIWHEELGGLLCRVLKLTPRRRAAIRGRLSDLGSLEAWRLYCRKIRRTPFLVGENDRRWQADFDWTVKQANMAKILEGKYERQLV